MSGKLFRFLIAGVFVLVTMASVLPALADPPDQGRWINEGDTSWPAAEGCGFEVLIHYSEVGHWNVYEWDSDGNPISWRINYSGQYTYANPANGKVVLGHAAESWTVDFPGAVVKDIGLAMHIRLPGGGVIIQDVGRLVWNPYTLEIYFEGGTHPMYPQGPSPVVCSLLA